MAKSEVIERTFAARAKRHCIDLVVHVDLAEFTMFKVALRIGATLAPIADSTLTLPH